mmetsp:Transcript_87964/g.253983  ORF Transcript_87964/g.253983 Transcript_87964/m.253983 type:complete len:241 (+) Transcript_87964:85-807(+)
MSSSKLMIAAWEPPLSSLRANSSAVACCEFLFDRSAPAHNNNSTASRSAALTAACKGKFIFRLKGVRPPLLGSLTLRKPAVARKRRNLFFRASRSGSRLLVLCADVAALLPLFIVFHGALGFSGRSSASSASGGSNTSTWRAALGSTALGVSVCGARGRTPGSAPARARSSSALAAAASASASGFAARGFVGIAGAAATFAHGAAATSSSPGLARCRFSRPRMTFFGESCNAVRISEILS